MVPDPEFNEIIRYALEDCGYRHLDCARVYRNQEEIGAALQFVFSRGKVKREDIWITSKLWDNMHRPEVVERACRETLTQLKLDYLDLYLMHHAHALKHLSDDNLRPVDDSGKAWLEIVPIADTWKVMETLVDKKLVRRIGVSNFTIPMLEKMRFNPEIRIQPFTNQIEFHIYLQQRPMRDYLKKRGIILSAYSPLGSPGLVDPRVRVPLLSDPVLLEVSKETGRSPGSVALRFLQQIESNLVILVKTQNKERLKENIGIDGFSLNARQIANLENCEKCYRYWRLQEEVGEDVIGEGW
jgi:aldehyde reductase